MIWFFQNSVLVINVAVEQNFFVKEDLEIFLNKNIYLKMNLIPKTKSEKISDTPAFIC